MESNNTVTKIYKIANVEFKLKKSYTLEELDLITEVTNKFVASKNNTAILATLTNKDIIRFISTILETDIDLPEDFSFGKCNEELAGEIVLDFFKFKFDQFLQNIKPKKAE